MKFEIFQSEKDKKYYFHLKARNGKLVLSSQGYSRKAGALKGVSSVKKNCSDDTSYERKVAKDGRHHFNLISKNKQIVGSSQLYNSKSSMESGIRSVKEACAMTSVGEL